ncbi:Cell division protein FtsQ [bioreactor metagenome]|uniref:Cell division protein FtsQ n=1 Tax=bioreactor metagenome TaxID=1076179 RepID=A0A645DCL0_9ZZZZ
MERKRKKGGRRKLRLGAKLILALLIALILFGLAFYLTYDMLSVHNIRVEGLSGFSQEEVIALSGAKTGVHILFADTRGITAALEQSPFFKVNGIRREWPDTLVIDVLERQRAAGIAAQDSAVVIDKDGLVLEIVPLSACSVMTVKGVALLGYKIGQGIEAVSSLHAQILTELISAVENTGLDIAAIEMDNLLNIKLLTNDGITIAFGSSEAAQKKAELAKKVLDELASRGSTGGIINVSGVSDAIYTPDATPTPEPDAPDNSPDPSSPEPDNAQQSTPGAQ